MKKANRAVNRCATKSGGETLDSMIIRLHLKPKIPSGTKIAPHYFGNNLKNYERTYPRQMIWDPTRIALHAPESRTASEALREIRYFDREHMWVLTAHILDFLLSNPKQIPRAADWKVDELGEPTRIVFQGTGYWWYEDEHPRLGWRTLTRRNKTWMEGRPLFESSQGEMPTDVRFALWNAYPYYPHCESCTTEWALRRAQAEFQHSKRHPITCLPSIGDGPYQTF